MADAFTAIIFLFHDHDWEADLMIKVFSTRAYFIGAMGSRDTHDRRGARLRHRGGSALIIQRIIGPVGLIHGARDADRLAVSILAQLVAASDSVSHSIGMKAIFPQHS
ncbi:XdhC family protein [Sphingobium yanoikuyae]|uniref:XdhC family protein n=1 Tax=Sphingobium yanoikuyae TaxID=13690 RepID=UPI0028A863CD|nr:XdhC family protein [Sphingobium yanoikuyae]